MSTRIHRIHAIPLATVLLLASLSGVASAREFDFVNLTDLPGGPGEGKDPRINSRGDVAFFENDRAWVYQAADSSFVELTALPGAPPRAWFPKLNDSGDVVSIDRVTGNLWFYEADTGDFTNISALPGAPAVTENFDLGRVFDLNDARQVSLHSGDRNTGRVWLYDHATGGFSQVTGRAGGAFFGRTNYLNEAGEVLYMGFPDAYLFDSVSGTTTNINGLPGGPGTITTDTLLLSDPGDVAIIATDIVVYTASDSSFLSLSSLAGFPVSFASSNRNGINERGEIVFWKDGIHYYDPTAPAGDSFTRLDARPGVPAGGLEASINASGDIAFAGGLDVFLAIPDADGDGVADREDNCVDVANPGQEDFNAASDDDTSLPGVQHYGDVCDADLDDDGLVGPSDFFGAFRPCLGADVATTPACGVADFDGDGVVASSDFFGGLRPALGQAPGPGTTEVTP